MCRFALAACLLGLLAGPAAGRAAETGGSALEHVTLQLKWRHQFQFAGYYAAIRQGYYRAAGLDVKLVEAQPGLDPVREVLEGRAEYGVGTSELLLLRNRGIPVVVLASIFQHSPQILLTRRTEKITDLQALHDQPIMLEPQSAELLAYFKDEGVDPSRLHIVHHTFDVKDLVEGRVAAMSAYVTDEPFQMKEAGVPFLTFTPRAGGIDFYGDNLFTLQGEIDRHPDRVRRFREASLRGWEYAMTHREEMIDDIIQRYHPPKSRAHLEFEAGQMEQLMHPGLIEIGHTNPGRWRHMAETYAEFGMLPKDFDLDGFLYDANPTPDYRWAYWTIAVISLIAVAALGWALPLYRLNHRLQAAKEAAEQADVAKGRYLAFMTHELRTPLNGVIGVIELLRGSRLDLEQREYVELIDQAAQNQLHLIDGVLDYAKLEAGRLELAEAAVLLPEFVAQSAELFRAAALAKGIALDCVLAPSVPRQVRVDPTRLRQVLGNLLANAVKFTATGGVRLEVRAETAAEGRTELILAVTDSGIGMDEATVTRLFQPYVQGSADIAGRFGGTGLGLAIVQRLVEAMHGSVTVQSKSGVGSTFTVRIPAGM